MKSRVLVDTGPLVAVVDRDDAHHALCVEFFDLFVGEVIVPAPVLVEVCWLLGRRLGPRVEAAFLARLSGDDMKVEELHDADYERVARLVDTYADLDLGIVDASVVAVAERLKLDQVATIDRRHFHVVRPRHVNAFTLLP